MTLIQVTEKNFISGSVTKQPHYLCLKKSNGPTNVEDLDKNGFKFAINACWTLTKISPKGLLLSLSDRCISLAQAKRMT